MIDFQDSSFLQDPYPKLNEVRESTPIFKQEGDHGSPDVWFLTRHDDVQSTMRSKKLGRTFSHVMSNEDVGVAPIPPTHGPFTDLERWSLLQLEPPEHTRIRMLLTQEFTPRRVAALEPRMVEIVDDLLDQVVASVGDDGEVELLSELAQPFSLLVMCELLGAPYEDRNRLLSWSHAIVKMYELDTSGQQVDEAIQASMEFSAWAKELITLRRRTPREDLVSGLCAARIDGEQLTDDEITSTIVLLLNAGHEATVNTLGNGITALLRHPTQVSKLQNGGVPWSSATEELFRFDSPLQLFERWVLADSYDVAGRTLERGSKIAMLLGSANRDPRKWDRPDEFDVTRADPTHVSFGFGIHHCIGAGLARLEVATVLNRLLTRFPEVKLARDPIRNQAFVIHGYERVDLSLS